MSCRDVADWLHRDVESLDEAQRLVLDDHLATCEPCRGDRQRMQLVHALGNALPVPPSGAREYNRAIAKALLEGKRTEEAEAPIAKPRRAKWIVPILAFAGIAAAATVAKVATDDDEIEEMAPAPSTDHAPTPSSHATDEVPSPTPGSPEPEPAPTMPTPAPAPAHHGSLTHTPAHRASAEELLERARREFAAKDFDTAEKTAQLALAAKPTKALSAEIHMLLAEIAQGAGKPDLAIERYTAVTASFKGTDAAESALYAAARIELKRRDTAAARVLLDRYLARYPTGRFADDARRELDALH